MIVNTLKYFLVNELPRRNCLVVHKAVILYSHAHMKHDVHIVYQSKGLNTKKNPSHEGGIYYL